MESAVILPPGVQAPTPVEHGNVIIDNRTSLPNGMVEGAVRDHFVENASLAWGHSNTFQTYANEGGSLLARTKFRVPTSVFEEIALARDIADRDDDVRATIGSMMAVAYSDGMQNFHEDERVVALFNEICRNMNLDHWLKEMYREYLIAAQVTTVTAYIRERLSFTPAGTKSEVEERLAAPLTGIIHAEQVRVIENDFFQQGGLGYLPTEDKQRKWLEEFFAERTTPARKNAMRLEDPVSAALFIEEVKIDERGSLLGTGLTVYRMNPRMAARFTMPKGARAYPRPLLTANFALIEAKRLLNIMDYALLQGGANFIVVAKKGTDQHRAQQEELDALSEVVARASRTGVIVGDHRLSFEIITPQLTELLNAEKRSLIGRRLGNLLVRVPEPTADGGTESMAAWIELATRVITSDRHDIKRHIERAIYAETGKRNSRVFKSQAPAIWHPKVILQGAQFFSDFVLKLRDRGDIPRKFAVEAAGFDWEAGVAQRKREKAAGTDDTMMPAAVPHDSPDNSAPPSDNGNGRPRGSSQDNGAPGARRGGGQDRLAPRRRARGPGEPVRAWWDEDLSETVRVGEVTYHLLEQYPDHEDGRLTGFERQALQSNEVATEGPVTVIPVNQGHDADRFRVVRLSPGLGVVLGYRTSDDALIAKAMTFRQPEFDALAAEELAVTLGYETHGGEISEEKAELEEQRTKKVITRTDQGYEVTEVNADE